MIHQKCSGIITTTTLIIDTLVVYPKTILLIMDQLQTLDIGRS